MKGLKVKIPKSLIFRPRIGLCAGLTSVALLTTLFTKSNPIKNIQHTAPVPQICFYDSKHSPIIQLTPEQPTTQGPKEDLEQRVTREGIRKQQQRLQPKEHYNFNESWQIIADGIYYMHETIDGPVNIYSVVVDLDKVKLHNVPAEGKNPNYRRENLASIVKRCPQAIVAVNCDYPNNTAPEGTNIDRVYTTQPSFNPWRASFYCDLEGDCNIDILREESLDKIVFAVGGGPIIMLNGEYNFNPYGEGFEKEILEKYENNRDAHTIALLSKGRRYLGIMVYDGRSSQSIGLAPKQAIEYAKTLPLEWGRAVMFDGGRSTQLWINGKIINNPIDGGRELSNILVIVPKHQEFLFDFY